MPQSYQWSKLTHLQVGRYAEYFVKMQFVLLGCDVYTAEVDEQGIDFVLRKEPGHYWDVQVKSIRNTGYIFFPKTKFRIRTNLLAAVAVFEDGREPDLFIVPAAQCGTPDGVFVDRDYERLASAPEYGLNLSKKGIKALERFRFGAALDNLLDIAQLSPEDGRCP
jgi:hypothetical protein